MVAVLVTDNVEIVIIEHAMLPWYRLKTKHAKLAGRHEHVKSQTCPVKTSSVLRFKRHEVLLLFLQ